MEYNPRILVDVYLSTTQHWSTEVIPVTDGTTVTRYDKRLIESPGVSKEIADVYWGVTEAGSINLKVDNHDAFLNTLEAVEEFRGIKIRVRRYEPNEPISANTLRVELIGYITEYNLVDISEITVALKDLDPLQTQIPKKLFEKADWTETPPNNLTPEDDIGTPYCLPFGHAKRVPLRYVHLDYDTDYYDYIICPGIIEGVDNVYRNLMSSEGGNEHELVNPSSYTVYTGTQDTPYTGYAFIRFSLEQLSFSNTMHQISADVKGYKIDGTTAERNFVSVIKGILSNTNWGLSMTVDSTTFTAAATQVADLYCDGHLSEQENVQDIIDELLFCCRGTLDRNEAGAWTITVDQTVTDSTISAYFGSGDGRLENIISIESLGKASSDETIKTYIIKYAYNAWKNNYARSITRNSDFTSFGVEETKELKFVWDGTTANKISEYVLKRTKYSDTKLKIVVGQEGRLLNTKDLVSVNIPRLGINSETFQVFSINKELSAITLDLVAYDPLIFVYDGGTIPDAPDNPDDDNWEDVTPTAPTSFSVDSSGTYQTDDGFKSAYVVLKADIPLVNATEIQFGYRIHNEAFHTFARGNVDSTNPTLWRARIDGLGQNSHYDFIAKTLNVYGLESSGNPTIVDWTAPSDSTAPATPANLTIVVGTGKVVSLDWDDNTESDLSEYRIYRRTDSTATPDTTHIIAEIRASRFVDINVDTTGSEYSYWVSALDTSENESALAGPVNGTPTGVAVDDTPPAQITTFHVDSTGIYQAGTGTTWAYVNFGWTQPTEHWAFTNLYYKRDSTSDLWMIGDINFDATSATSRVDDLIPGLAYNFKVVAVNGSGVPGPDSTTVTLTAPGDSTAPGVPVLSLARQGRVITASVVPQTEADLGGYEFHASLVNGFTPDSTTLKQRGNSNVYTLVGTADAQSWYFKARSYDLTPNYSAYCSQQTIATEGILVDDGNPPSTPTGLSLTTGVAQNEDGSDYSWIRATWNANGESDLAYYEYRVKETGGNYVYGLVASNEKLFSPVRSNVLHYIGIRAIDIYGNPSAFCSDSTTTSSKDAVAPGVVTNFTATAAFNTIFLTWTLPSDKDIKFVEIFKSTDSTRSHAVSLAKVNGTFYSDKIPTYGSQRWYWARTQDLSDNTSVTEAGSVNATTATVVSTDIGTFAITASKIYTRIPILDGDTWTDNSPSPGYVAWNSHTIYYNGVAYTMVAGNTNLKYIYWGMGNTTYFTSDTNPAFGTDYEFVIATNISGTHDLAWNAIANQVIGSAYIQDLAVTNAKIANLAVDNAKINDLNAIKINAGDIATARMQVYSAAAVNAGSTLITPGKILIKGSTTLQDWQYGGDSVEIDGGDIHANTITANKLSIGSRNISIQGIEISANYPVANTLYWTAGIISYVNDAGTSVDATTTSGSQLCSQGTTRWLYWAKDTTVLLTTITRATAFDATNMVLATYKVASGDSSSTDLVVNYGRTIIDGSKIITDSITASQIAALTITSSELAAGSITADKIAIGGGTNICHPRYCDFEESSLPPIYYAGQCTVSQDSGAGNYYFGSKSLKMSCTGLDAHVYLCENASDYNIKLTPQKKWLVSAWIKCDLASRSIDFYLNGNDTNHYLGNSTSGLANVWTRVYAVVDMSGSASTVTSARLRIDCNDANNGHYMWIDGIMVEEALGATTPSIFTYPGQTIITGGQITTNSITSTQLATSNLITVSAQIADAVITDAKISDLTVGKLTVNPALRNLVSDGKFELGDLTKEWYNQYANITIQSGTPGTETYTGLYSCKFTGDGIAKEIWANKQHYTPVTPGQKYHAEAYLKHSAVSNWSYLGIEWTDQNKANPTYSTAASGATAWEKISVDSTVAAGKYFMRMFLATNSALGAGEYVWFDDFIVYEQTDTTYIADNAVTWNVVSWGSAALWGSLVYKPTVSCTITTTGGPVMIVASSYFYSTNSTSRLVSTFIGVDGTTLTEKLISSDVSSLYVPSSGKACITMPYVHTPAAGTHTYYHCGLPDGTTIAALGNMFVVELKK